MGFMRISAIMRWIVFLCTESKLKKGVSFGWHSFFSINAAGGADRFFSESRAFWGGGKTLKNLLKTRRIGKDDVGRAGTFMKKAVFFDIDGTIWNEKMEVPESTKTALKKLKQEGHYAFLCTGRSRSNVNSPKLAELGFDGIVAACGTHVEFQGEKAFEKLLSRRQLDHALAALKKHRIPAVLEGPNFIYVEETEFLEDPYVIELRRELGEQIRPISGMEAYEVNKMSVAIGSADTEQFIADLGDEFEVIVHRADAIAEIGIRGFTKATGIEKICRLLDIAREDTYAFGDSANDLEMLAFVAHGVAMGNAAPEVKEAAEYVTASVDEGGIEKGLLHYGLIS